MICPSIISSGYPCGKCAFCLKEARKDWFTRLLLEKYSNDLCYFITLTFEDEHIQNNLPVYNGYYGLDKTILQKFIKRVRKKMSKQEIRVRYFGIGELGSNTLRPHFHLLCYLSKSTGFRLKYKDMEVAESIADCWRYGFVSYSPATPRRLNYVLKDMLKVSKLPPNWEKAPKDILPFRIMSKNPPIGLPFLLDNLKDIVKQLYNNDEYEVTIKNHSFIIPRSLREKLFEYLPKFNHSFKMFGKEFNGYGKQVEVYFKKQNNYVSRLNEMHHLVDDLQRLQKLKTNKHRVGIYGKNEL